MKRESSRQKAEGSMRHVVSRITHRASRITHHASRITHHASRITFHASRITFHVSRPTLHGLRTSDFGLRTSSAFTMIEIAISLAVIGFALVAIIGVLPIGMNVQKVNREETIINQEANLFMDAIRNGAQGLDDLTNYVMAITNHATLFNANGIPGRTFTYGYTLTSSSPSGFPLINGFRIVGLLSTPKYVPDITIIKGAPTYSGYYSNHVVAYVRSMSGAASAMFPQNNSAMQDLAFSYRMTSEVVPYGTNYYDPTWVTDPNYARLARNVSANLNDVRLYFRWPLQSSGTAGQNGQSYRTLASGQLFETNVFGGAYNPASPFNLYFVQPSTYVQTQ
jgi:type II secretory pathway pseudopilin PulG